MKLPPLHAHPDVTAVRALLAAAGLPTADLTAASRAEFWGCEAGQELAGAIGLETLRVGRPAPFAGGRASGWPFQAACRFTQATYWFIQLCKNSLLAGPILPAASNSPSLAWMNASGWPKVGMSR